MSHDDEILDLLPSVLDGTASPEERERVQRHLDESASSRAKASMMRLAHEALLADGARAAHAAQPVRPPSPLDRRTPPARRRWDAAVLTGVLGVALGFFAGSRPGEPDAPSAGVPGLQEYVLLLEETPDTWPPDAPLNRPGYIEWGAELVEAGVAGAGIGRRLQEDDGIYLASDGSAIPAGERPPSVSNFSGWFVVRAASYEDALALARRSPHLDWGGILIRASY